jgi:hypothetical protein
LKHGRRTVCTTVIRKPLGMERHLGHFRPGIEG